ncbi:MAG TPA: Flp family type IVb pilin [Sphingomicrobium sp.]|nr:Flp family type IVb pilin [Sphingomicrobium sp.]
MVAIRQYFLALLASQRGATAIEYALIAALICIALIGAMNALGGGVGGMWGELSSTVQNNM